MEWGRRDNSVSAIHELIPGDWHSNAVPQNWENSIALSINKDESFKSQCDDYCGMNLLGTIVKVLSRELDLLWYHPQRPSVNSELGEVLWT